MNVLLSLGGMNTANPRPTNPFQQALYSVAKGISNSLDPAPRPGTPTVGTPDTNSGAVAGTLGFPTGSGLTYTVALPTQGSLTLSGDGTYTYTPTQTARQAATASSTDTFTVTVHNGLSTSSVTITVPIDPGTPVAGTPVVGTPNPSTGTVTGTAKFTDTAGRTLTYSTTATSTGGGTVTLNTTTGAFTYTPTDAQRQTAAPGAIDTFTITSSNGVRATTQTITVAVDVSSPIAGTPTVGTPNTTTGEVTGNAKFTDAAGRTLTYSASGASTGGGTVTLNTTTGAFTYTPTQAQRQAAGLNTTDTFNITASNGVHTTNQTITVTVDPGTVVAGTPVVGTPDASTGMVAVQTSFADTAGRTLTYSVSDSTAAGGTVVFIGPSNGGTFWYTPTWNQRHAADSTTTDTFTVTVSNGLVSTTQTVTVQVQALPALPAGQVTLPGIPGLAPIAGPNGVIYQAAGGYITLIHPDGSVFAYNQPTKGLLVTADGSVYGATSTSTSAGSTTTLRVRHPDGSTTDYTAPGSIGYLNDPLAMGPDGTVYLTSLNGSESTGYTTVVLIVRPDGTSTTHSQSGDPGMNGVHVGFASDGTAYQFSSTHDGITNVTTTYVTAFRGDGTTVAYTLNGSYPFKGWLAGPNGSFYVNLQTSNAATHSVDYSLVKLNSDGTTTSIPGLAKQASNAVVDSNGNIYRNSFSSSGGARVDITHPDGTTATYDFGGQPYGPVVLGAGGRAYQVIRSSNSITVIVFGPTGGTTAYTQPGSAWGTAVVGPDGTVYQASYDLGPYLTTVRAFHPDGTTTDYRQSGSLLDGGLVIGADGTVYQATTKMVRAFHPDGTFIEFSPSGDSVTGITVGGDGTIYQTGHFSDDSSTVVSVRHLDGTFDNYALAGIAIGLVVIAQDGTPYQATSTGLWNLNKTPKAST